MSPQAHEQDGYDFRFYSSDGKEPRHVHVRKAENRAKFWLDPEPQLEYNYGFSPQQMRRIERILARNLEKIRRKWDEHFAQ